MVHEAILRGHYAKGLGIVHVNDVAQALCSGPVGARLLDFAVLIVEEEALLAISICAVPQALQAQVPLLAVVPEALGLLQTHHARKVALGWEEAL